MHLGPRLGRENYLSEPITVAQVDEQQVSSVVTILIDPTTEGDLAADVRRPQLATSMSPDQRRSPYPRIQEAIKPSIVKRSVAYG